MVEVILAEMSFDAVESIRSGVSLTLQLSERLHELSMPSKSCSSVDARHALCEMSCVVLRHTSPMFFPRSLWTLWFRCCTAAVFVSNNANHTSIFWSVYSHPTQTMVEHLYPFCVAPAWLLHTTRSCIALHIICELSTTFI